MKGWRFDKFLDEKRQGQKILLSCRLSVSWHQTQRHGLFVDLSVELGAKNWIILGTVNELMVAHLLLQRI